MESYSIITNAGNFEVINGISGDSIAKLIIDKEKHILTLSLEDNEINFTRQNGEILVSYSTDSEEVFQILNCALLQNDKLQYFSDKIIENIISGINYDIAESILMQALGDYIDM